MEIRITTAVLFTILLLLIVAVLYCQPSIKHESKSPQQCIEKVKLGLKSCIKGASQSEKAGCAIEAKRQLETRCDINHEFSRLMIDDILKQLFEIEV